MARSGRVAGRKKRMKKCLVLLSGGLDSRLACRMLQEQMGERNVEAVFFALPFGGGCCSDRFCVLRFAQDEGVKLHIVDCMKGALFRKYMEVVRKPRFGRGAGLNPCIDCHLFMLKEAKKLAAKTGASFLATGEVLGERPFSQNRHAMALMEREAGLEGRVLRPLSARLMPETEAERRNWVDRERLLGIHGRRRLEQLALAKNYGISFPSPAGGCLLTDRAVSERLLFFLKNMKNTCPDCVALVRLGRHFRKGNAAVIVGRNHRENIILQALAKRLGLPALEVEGVMGPATVVAGGKPSKTTIRAAALLTARYSDAPKGKKCVVLVKSGKDVGKMRVTAPHDTGFMGKI